eukprot:CAMPEP_0117784750 /NCGR_PEP_ID=MMETSP0948-20121206/4849_1 /TAXON_ID=44440 /ORGANISM="Chattonella subsalsa, Strain CCMP2191" /LENGTH=69 /DNA_ID=CAMNT_0005613475 /DNA_START=379 /DNA_END=588 /DNA_ORIENTATION=+
MASGIAAFEVAGYTLRSTVMKGSCSSKGGGSVNRHNFHNHKDKRSPGGFTGGGRGSPWEWGAVIVPGVP